MPETSGQLHTAKGKQSNAKCEGSAAQGKGNRESSTRHETVGRDMRNQDKTKASGTRHRRAGREIGERGET